MRGPMTQFPFKSKWGRCEDKLVMYMCQYSDFYLRRKKTKKRSARKF